MKLHELAGRAGARKTRKRIGRGIGSGVGKTGGRGGKGQTARSGVRIKGFEGGQMPLHRRLPKRGFKNVKFARKLNEVNLDRLQSAIDAGRLDLAATIDAAALVKAGVLRRAKDLGLVCAVVPPALERRNLDHRDLDPFFALAAELDLPLGIHGAPGLHMPKIGIDRFDNYVQVHCVSFPFDQMTAMTAMVSGGVFDRHPTLRVAFLEAGAGWLPWFVERLGEHFESRGDWIDNGWQRHPDEYLAAGNIWVTCEPEERMLPAVVEQIGADHVMFASDYPHWDGAWPHSSGRFLQQELKPDALAHIAGENARRFYGLPEP